MITMLGSPRLSCDGLTRRETLRVGALSLLGGFFNLPSLLALEQRRDSASRPGKARSVILLYLLGGAATQDMFDLKPGAPQGVRSEFRPMPTSASGVQICEHLPRMARLTLPNLTRARRSRFSTSAFSFFAKDWNAFWYWPRLPRA